MKIRKAPREFALDQLPPGMSKKTIEYHYSALYQGYVNKFNEIQDKLEETKKAGNATYSPYRELKREELFAADAIRLHEAYFNCLGGEGRCEGTILSWIDHDFGSYENWVEDLRASAMSARGWVVLAYDLTDNRLCNYTTDIHSDGAWAAVPLLVLDVYEHAYYGDFGPNRSEYIEAWLQNINWAHVNEQVTKSGLRPPQAA